MLSSNLSLLAGAALVLSAGFVAHAERIECTADLVMEGAFDHHATYARVVDVNLNSSTSSFFATHTFNHPIRHCKIYKPPPHHNSRGWVLPKTCIDG